MSPEKLAYYREYYRKHEKEIRARRKELRERYSVPRQLSSHGYYSKASIEAAYGRSLAKRRGA